MTFLLTVVFFGIFGLFGFTISAYILKVREILGTVAITCTAGSAFFMVVSNAFAYLMPIKTSFLLTLALMLLSSLIILATIPWKVSFSLLPRSVLCVFALVFAFTALAYMRDRGSDEWTWSHLALSSTILEGNFPPLEPANPWELTNYHYGYTLIVAGISFFTKLSLTASHIFLPAIAAAGILFFAGAIARRLTVSAGAVALAAIFTFGAAGLFWLQGWWLLKDLWEHFVLGNIVEPSPFQWLTPTIRTLYAQPWLMMLGHRAISLGGAFTLALLYCLQTLWFEHPRKRLPWIIVAIFFGAALANTMETTLLTLVVTLVAFLPIVYLQMPGRWKEYILVCLLIFVPVLIIGFTQGGTLSTQSGAASPGQFTLNLTGHIFHDANIANDSIVLWEWRFFREFGLHVILSILAGIFFWKKKNTFALFILTLAFIHFLIPLIVFYKPFPGNLLRFFYTAFSISSLAIGIYIWEVMLYPASRSAGKLRFFGGVALISAMLFAGILNVAVRLVFPTLRLEATEFFPSLAQETEASKKMYSWVRTNTTLQDYFFIFNTEEKDPIGGPETLKDRLRFSYSTGRFVIGSANISAPPPDKMALIHGAERCELPAFEALHIRYLVVPSERQAPWFKTTCTPAHWKLVYGGSDPFPRIYERQ
jgi:hypothetical protein